MVFFNYATMQMAAKIVYYGPGLCGKTTNLHHIYGKTSPQSRGEMVSLETETDRTLFFDLLPIDVGVIGGFKTRLQLYTIPGQVFYNTTRKLVLKGVDGLVFVADSQVQMLDANIESFNNLRENLREIGLVLDDIPLVLQLNKRDLPSVATIDSMLAMIDPERKYDYVESVASTGVGVFETLKMISKLTLRTLRRRMTGEEPLKTPARRGIGEVAAFRVKEDLRGTVAGGTPTPAVGTVAGATALVAPEPINVADEIDELVASEEIFAESALASSADVDAHIISEAPVAEPPPPTPLAEAAALAPELEAAPEPELEPEPEPEPEIDFSQSAKPAKKAQVKHVKVRSSVDIMAELESLRKKATQSTPKPAKKEVSPLDLLRNPRKREMHKSITLPVAPGVLPKATSLHVAVSFQNEEGGIVQSQEQTVELGDATDVQSLSVNLKFEI
jgi:signal recognition particle receptor subunit beta